MNYDEDELMKYLNTVDEEKNKEIMKKFKFIAENSKGEKADFFQRMLDKSKAMMDKKA